MGDLFCEKCGADTHMTNLPPENSSKRKSNVLFHSSTKVIIGSGTSLLERKIFESGGSQFQ
jgi:hypothetical protein